MPSGPATTRSAATVPAPPAPMRKSAPTWMETGLTGGSEPLSQERLVARRGKFARERDDEDGVKAKPREHAHAVLNRKQRVVDDGAGE